MRKAREACIAFVMSAALLFSAAAPAHAQDEEHDLIAVFLVNFLNFAVWPDAAAANEKHICVYGNDKIVEVVQYIIDKKKLSVQVMRIGDGDPVAACHILFISKSHKSDAEAMLAKIAAKPVLTASDIPGFATSGGVIEFMKSDNKFKLRVNVREYKSRGLKLDPRMLQLVELVDS